MRVAWILAIIAGCGSVKSEQHDAPLCTHETDMAFCARLGKNCGSVMDADNCDQIRTAECGACSGGTPVCSATNVCVAPECGTSFVGTAGTPITDLNLPNIQSALLGVAANGGSVLYLRATTACVTSGSDLLIADEAVAGTPPYVIHSLGSNPNLAGFSRVEESMTLSADGLTIVGVGTDNRSFLTSSRSAVGGTDFSAASAGLFATLNISLPAAPATVSWPLLSHDGLGFTFRIDGSDANTNGIYETTRTATTAAFPPATKLPGAIQTFESISGMSSDRLTAFVAMNFGTQIVTRPAVDQPFTAAAGSTPPGNAFRIVPIAGCGLLFGTCEPGGCNNEGICTWAKN
jgi:hypothetical protein